MTSDSLMGVAVMGVPPAEYCERFWEGIACTCGGGDTVRGVAAGSGLTGETCLVLAEAAAEAAPGDVRRVASGRDPSPALSVSPPTGVGGTGGGGGREVVVSRSWMCLFIVSVVSVQSCCM